MRQSKLCVTLALCAPWMLAASAGASLTIKSVTLNGGTSTTVPPGGPITVVVTERNAGGDNWRATLWNIDSDNCTDHGNHDGNGTFTDSFTIAAPIAPGIYSINFWAYAADDCGLPNSLPFTLLSAITVCSSTALPPTSASVDQNNFCQGAFANITLTASGGSGDALVWYSGACGSTSVGSGTPLTIPAPATTTTYFARWEVPNCNSSCASVTVTVNAQPGTPTTPTASPATVCIGVSSTLSATAGAGETVDWFTGICGDMLVGSGPSLGVTPGGTTTYYARARNTTTGCASAACANVTVTVNSPLPDTPTAPMASPTTICNGASSILSASVNAGETVDWFTGSCGGTSVGTGTPLSVSPTSTTTYYARARNTTTGCISTTCAQVIVTVNPRPNTPTSPSATPSSICSGASSSLSATVAAGQTVDWFTGSCGGTSVGSGTPMSVSPSATTTYYARARDTTTGCVSTACAQISVTVSALPNTPTSPAASPTTTCGGSTTLSASVGSGQTVDWFTGSCGGTPVGSGTSLSVTPTTTTAYYARARNTSTGCISAACASVTVTVNTPPNTPTNATAVPATIFSGEASTLSASVGAGETVDWYTGSCGGTSTGTGTSLNVSPNSTTTYYARARNTTTGCVSAACAQVTVTVTVSALRIASVTLNGASSVTVLPGGSISAVVTTVINGGTWRSTQWNITGNNCVNHKDVAKNGTSSITISITAPSAPGTYSVTFTDCSTNTCGGQQSLPFTLANSITVCTNATAPTSAAVNRNNICSGDGSITLTATGGSGVALTWYRGSCGGTFVGTGTPLTIPAPSSTTKYYARWESAPCTNSSCALVTVTVNSLPSAPTKPAASPATVCGGATSTLSVSLGNGLAVDWFAGSCGGTPVGTGTPLNVNPTSTSTYYARSRNTTTGCVSASCAQVTVNVNPAPNTPSSIAATPSTICSGSSTLSATVGSGQAIDWFTGSCGGTSIGSGATRIVSPTSTTTYYARARNTTTGCLSLACASVTVTVVTTCDDGSACTADSCVNGQCVHTPIDFDGDGTPDCQDGCPADPNKTAPGQCGCGTPDTDTDGDGVANCVDGCPLDPSKTAPGICGCGTPDTDTDGDTVANCIDGCPLDPNKTAPGICGCGVSDIDTDSDGTPDCNDLCPSDPSKIAPGICGCGVSDIDSDGDGTPDCNDQCPSDPSKIAPGICGCGVSDVDSDGDGTPDCNDLCPADPNKTAPGKCGCGVPDTPGCK